MKPIPVIVVSVLMILPVLAQTNNWSVASVENADYNPKIIFHILGTVDGASQPGTKIVDFDPDGPTIWLETQGKKFMLGKGQGQSGYAINGRIRATLTNDFSNATTNFRISNRREDMISLGTNTFWVVDIRGSPDSVVLKDSVTRSNCVLRSNRAPAAGDDSPEDSGKPK